MNKIDYWIKEIEQSPEFKINRGTSEKVRWLNTHLREYLARWQGFAIDSSMGVKAALANDIFYLILASVKIMNKIIEGGGLPTLFPIFEWKQFEIAVDFIQCHPKEENISFVLDRFDDYDNGFE